VDHQGFARTIYALSKPGARAVLSFNNPYSSLVRGRIKDYFASGRPASTAGWPAGEPRRTATTEHWRNTSIRS